MATPAAGREWLARLRKHTDKPVRYLVLSHYHAVRVLGASAFGAETIVTHEKTRELIAERGRQDWESEYARMPRLFREPASMPGLTWPTATFSDRFTIDLGGGRGDLVLQYCGRGHTEGDIVAWLPDRRILFAGDLVEAQAALYTGDAFHREWAARTPDPGAALGAGNPVGGRGAVGHRAGARSADGRARGEEPVPKSLVKKGEVLDGWNTGGAGRRIAGEGVAWTTARTFYRDADLFSVTFPGAGRPGFPPFVNISQSRTEEILDEC